jgi:hypothetical protein
MSESCTFDAVKRITFLSPHKDADIAITSHMYGLLRCWFYGVWDSHGKFKIYIRANDGLAYDLYEDEFRQAYSELVSPEYSHWCPRSKLDLVFIPPELQEQQDDV